MSEKKIAQDIAPTLKMLGLNEEVSYLKQRASCVRATIQLLKTKHPMRFKTQIKGAYIDVTRTV